MELEEALKQIEVLKKELVDAKADYSQKLEEKETAHSEEVERIKYANSLNEALKDNGVLDKDVANTFISNSELSAVDPIEAVKKLKEEKPFMFKQPESSAPKVPAAIPFEEDPREAPKRNSLKELIGGL